MLKLFHTVGKYSRILPLVVAFGATVVSSPQVFADPGASDGTGRGEAPARHSIRIPFYTLSRMNNSALRSLVQQPNAHFTKRADGIAGRYDIGILVHALRDNRPRTIRLIGRLEEASSEAERKEIIFGLLKVHSERLERERRRLAKMRGKLRVEGRLDANINPYSFDVDHEDPDVATFHTLRKMIVDDQSYVSLLGHMTLGY